MMTEPTLANTSTSTNAARFGNGGQQEDKAMNRHKVLRTVVWTLALQAAIYVALALFGPWRPRPAVPEPVADRRPILEWLPSRQREVIEQVLAGWQTRLAPNAAATPFGTQIAREHPGAYAVEYRKQGATIWMLYSAANEQIAVRYGDE
jgi:hypothetical protein